ncbi:hypothetical protein M3J09_007815 [Ascochyta lentis]
MITILGWTGSGLACKLRSNTGSSSSCSFRSKCTAKI